MTWQEVASKITDIAPIAGGIIGGPLGAGIGTAVKALAGVFGIKSPDPKPEEVMAAIQADPQAALKLEMVRLEFLRLEYEAKDQERDDALEELKTRLADVQSARDREIKQTEKTGYRDWNLYLLSYILIGGFFFLTGYLMEHKLPDESSSVVFMLFGALASGFGQVIQYFFGSSKGSKDKDMMLLSAEPKK